MKTMKRALAVLLAAVLLCVGVPFAFAEGETEYQVGDHIQFGTYPQTRVDETPELQDAANAATWKSYDYYTGTGEKTDGNMTSGDWMIFADFFCGDEKYRAVIFSSYRPSYTGYPSSADDSYQDNNGYLVDNTYFFKYEPLTWRILDPSTGYIMCENIIDSQAYQNTVYFSHYYWKDKTKSNYASDYAFSSIREWLNTDFYDTAFTNDQKLNVKISLLNNDSSCNSSYNSEKTNDRVFIPSYTDLTNKAYGFYSTATTYDPARCSQGTDYARCQGLYCYGYNGNSYWWLRSPGHSSETADFVYSYGDVGESTYVYETNLGVRPACCLSNLMNDASLACNLFSNEDTSPIHNYSPIYFWSKDDTTVTATMVCTRCDKTGATETAEVTNEVTVKPTCSTEGELTMIAAFNNKSFYGQTKTKTLPRDPDAHVFKVTVTPPTCLDDGYTTHACTLCRYGYSDEIVAALGHDYQHHDAKAPTCEAPGWDAYDTCSRCDYTTYSELATVDHDDADNDGKCDMCGDQMRGGSHCKYCGKIHGGAFGWLTKLIHSILAVFKR